MAQFRSNNTSRKTAPKPAPKRKASVTILCIGSFIFVIAVVSCIAINEIVNNRVLSNTGTNSLLLMQAEDSLHGVLNEALTVKTKSATAISRQERPTIHVLGERHSGTKWITQHLEECFNHTADIRRGLTRWKHWFQEDGYYSEHPIGKTATVVAQFRHVLQWVKAMQTDSYHAPSHFNRSWSEYVTQPWTMPRFGQDLNVDLSSNETICQYSFRPNQVIPCLEVDAIRVHNDREVFPCYEMRNDGSGRPYQSILELRRDKIYNFLSIRDFQFITAFFAVQYEKMAARGTKVLIEKIEKALQTKARCIPSGPQKLSYRRLPYKYVNYMTDHVDWGAEALIGYTTTEPYKEISTT